MPRKKKLSDEEAEERKRLARRKYKLKKKLGSKDGFGDPNLFGEEVDPTTEINRQLTFERNNPFAEMFKANFPTKKKKKKNGKRND